MKTIALLLLAAVLPAKAATVMATWNPNPERDIREYRLYYGTNSHIYNLPTVTIPAPSTTAIVTGLVHGVTYYFAVSVWSSNNLESALSDEVAFPVPVPPVPPSKPTNLRITGTTNQTASITVDHPSTHVIVQYSPDLTNWVNWAQLKSLNEFSPVDKAIYLAGVAPEGSRYWRSLSLAHTFPVQGVGRSVVSVVLPCVPELQTLP